MTGAQKAKKVIEVLDPLNCPVWEIAEYWNIDNLEKSYEIVTEKPKVTLTEFRRLMGK